MVAVALSACGFGMAIHILEADPAVNDSLALLLRNLGHEVLSHSDAASFFRGDPPSPQDSVILDLMLGDVSGVAVIKWLQRLREPPHIIAVSGEPRMVIDAQLRGMDVPHLLRKPLCEDLITAKLARH
jgi:DNA-binding response OmpR family regulator